MSNPRKLSIEVGFLRSQHDPRYTALDVGDIRIGPDAGPWIVEKSIVVATSSLKDAIAQHEARYETGEGTIHE